MTSTPHGYKRMFTVQESRPSAAVVRDNVHEVRSTPTGRGEFLSPGPLGVLEANEG